LRAIIRVSTEQCNNGGISVLSRQREEYTLRQIVMQPPSEPENPTMSKANKKQRHEAKRKVKKLQLKRENSISPIKRLADAPGEIECWESEDFVAFGQMQLFVFKRAAGVSGLACFLIDRGVVGLKDAWVKMNVDRSDLTDMIDFTRKRGIKMRAAKLEDARQSIAGAIRWAHENGMRLPKDWPRIVSVFGGVGDWASADLSQFALEFTGHPDDLRQRLIAEPFETFIQRPDIDFVFSDAAPYSGPRTNGFMELDDSDDGDDEA
jgi:hypothetical protein